MASGEWFIDFFGAALASGSFVVHCQHEQVRSAPRSQEVSLSLCVCVCACSFLLRFYLVFYIYRISIHFLSSSATDTWTNSFRVSFLVLFNFWLGKFLDLIHTATIPKTFAFSVFFILNNTSLHYICIISGVFKHDSG